jgi:hypothetical protein
MNKLAISAALTARALVWAGEAVAEEGADTGDAATTGSTENAPATGQDVRAPESAVALGVDKGVLVPIGDWGAFAGVGLGVLGRVEYLLSPRLALTLNPGLLFRLTFFPAFHGGGVEKSTTEFLLAGGVKYMVTPELGLHALAGLNLRTVWAEGAETRARGAVIVGGRYKLSRAWSIGANLLVPNLLLRDGDEDIGKGIMFTVGHGRR